MINLPRINITNNKTIIIILFLCIIFYTLIYLDINKVTVMVFILLFFVFYKFLFISFWIYQNKLTPLEFIIHNIAL